MGETAQQAGPPSFRDVLRGRVGQECQASAADGVWTLWFPLPGAVPSADQPPKPMEAEQAEARRNAVEQELVLVQASLDHMRDGPQRALRVSRRDQLLTQLEQRVRHDDGQAMTLASVGSDFIQLREADGTERFIPLERVNVVVMAMK